MRQYQRVVVETATAANSSETWRAGETFDSGIGMPFADDIATFTV